MAVKHMFYATVAVCIHFYTHSLNTKFIEYSYNHLFYTFLGMSINIIINYTSTTFKLSQSLQMDIMVTLKGLAG